MIPTPPAETDQPQAGVDLPTSTRGEMANEDKTTEDAPAKTEEVPAEVLRDKLSEANKEAANYRVKFQEAQKRLAESKTVEEFQAATADMQKQIDELTRLNTINEVARATELPAGAMKFLQGSTKEELEQSAIELKKLFGAQRQAPSIHVDGGMSPAVGGAVVGRTPLELAEEMRKNTRRR